MPAETHSHRGSLAPEDLSALICDLTAEVVGADPDDVSLATRFVEDLGVDSLLALELVEVLEHELGERTIGLQFDDEDLADLLTVGDAVDYVAGRIG